MTLTVKKCVAAAAVMLALVSCSDFDNDWDAKRIQYQENFENLFGKIDPNQDWNLAERGTVTVTTNRPSNIKIYAKNGNSYKIVGDYSDVNGTKTLGFDVVEGTKEIMVSDGSLGQKCNVGGAVVFANSVTRALYNGTYDPDENPGNPDGNEMTVTRDESKTKIFTRDEVQAWNQMLPEIAVSGESNGLTSMKTHKLCNLNKVTKDFMMVSTGTFYLYPLFFLTSQTNTVGLYVKYGNVYKYAPLYTIKSGDELQTGSYGAWSSISSDPKAEVNRIGYDYEANGYTSENFTEAVWEEKTMEYDDYTVPGGFYSYNSTTGDYDWQQENKTLNNGDKYKSLKEPAKTRNYQWTNVGYSMANDDGTLQSGFDKVKSVPVKVEVPAGTVFGLYVQVGGQDPDTNPSPTFYSQSELNSDMDYVLAFDAEGVVDPSKTTLSATRHASHVATFELNGTTYIGFEDWTNVSMNSDMDLNDVMMVIEGAIPATVDEDPEKSAWTIACEDLGSTDDVDFNDIVFNVEHVSGRPTATITPLAAGGVLASTIKYNSTEIGEIHQLLGAAPASSGDYSFINTESSSRGHAGAQKTITVPEDFSLANFEVASSGLTEGQTSMGGFSIVTEQTSGNANAVTITAPKTGSVPQMICLPAVWDRITETKGDGTEVHLTGSWAWPTERTPIGANQSTVETSKTPAYTEDGHSFAAWVGNTSNSDWYMYPHDLNGGTVNVTTNSTEYEVGGGSQGGGNSSVDVPFVVDNLGARIAVADLASQLGGLVDADVLTFTIQLAEVHNLSGIKGSNETGTYSGTDIVSADYSNKTEYVKQLTYSQIKDYTYIFVGVYDSTPSKVFVKKN